MVLQSGSGHHFWYMLSTTFLSLLNCKIFWHSSSSTIFSSSFSLNLPFLQLDSGQEILVLPLVISCVTYCFKHCKKGHDLELTKGQIYRNLTSRQKVHLHLDNLKLSVVLSKQILQIKNSDFCFEMQVPIFQIITITRSTSCPGRAYQQHSGARKFRFVSLYFCLAAFMKFKRNQLTSKQTPGY